MKQTRMEDLLVSAASISATLREVSQIAKTISIGVKNAKAIAARAGDQALGFQPITDFINEMAMDIIQLVSEIDRRALAVTRMATAHTRSVDACRRLDIVVKESETIKYRHQLKDVQSKMLHEAEDSRIELRNEALRLDLLLNDIIQKVRAAKVISSSSRIEASAAKEFRQNLEGVAENLEGQTDLIKKDVGLCQQRLARVIELLN